MATNEFDKILTQARKNATDINKLATKLGVNLSSYFPDQLKALNDCLDTYSASKVMVATVVADARGELSLEGVAKLASNFDKNWDKFAAEYSAIFSHSSSAAKTNVLETFARNHFGDAIFEAGSVIKNETPNILNGILGFQRGIDAFGGSYRNPEEAANKIKTGVSLIVNSTAQVANSANNVLKFIQGFKQTDPKGSAILSNIAKLPQWRPVASAISVLGIGSAGISLAGSAKGALESLKKGDIAGAAQQGKAVLSQAKTIKDEISKLKSGAFSKNDTLSRSGTLSKGGELSGGNIPPSKANASNTNANAAQKQESNDSKDSGNSGNSDSYVCSTARIRCTNGDKISQLTVLPDRTIWLTGQPQANISDHQSMVNIAPFGRCHTVAYPPTGSATAAAHGRLTPMPCVPNTPFPWMNGKDDVVLKGQPALLKSSTCRCIYGGVITITYDGQSPQSAFTGAHDCFKCTHKEHQLQSVNVLIDCSAISYYTMSHSDNHNAASSDNLKNPKNTNNPKRAELLKNILRCVAKTIEPVVYNEDVSDVNVDVNLPPIIDVELKEILSNIFTTGLTIVSISGIPIAVPLVLLNSKVRHNIQTIYEITVKNLTDTLNPFNPQVNSNLSPLQEYLDTTGKRVSSVGSYLDAFGSEKNIGYNKKGKKFRLYNQMSKNNSTGKFTGNKNVRILGGLKNVGKLSGYAGTILSLPGYYEELDNAKSVHEVLKISGGKIGSVGGAFVGGEVGAIAGTAIVGSLVAAGTIAGSAVVVPALIVGGCAILGGAAIGAIGEWIGGSIGENTGKIIEHNL